MRVVEGPSGMCLCIPHELADSLERELERPRAAQLSRLLHAAEHEECVRLPVASAEAAEIVFRMRTCSLSGLPRALYMEGVHLELLALSVHGLAAKDTTTCAARRPPAASDIFKLEEAVTILNDRFRRPPSIAELAAAVGLNTTKLKVGFKQLFGTTVYGYVRRTRMEHARRLLRATDASVGEIAWEVGYGTPSAFSAAFKRQFGVSPHAERERALSVPE
jgi:AraC-like DNA-binding protein